MKSILNVHALLVLFSTSALLADATTAVRPLLSFRSQGQDLALQMVGMNGHTYKADMDTHYGTFSFTPEYTQSFHNSDNTRALFGCWYLQDCATLSIDGASASTFDAHSLNARWFGLAEDYAGTICFKPTIKNVNAAMDFYWGMDEWVQGLFFRIASPLTWSKWDLGAQFNTTHEGTITIPDVTLLDDAEKYFCKKENESSSTYETTALNCARFCGCACSNKGKTRLADIHMDLGWNYLLDDNYHMGVFARLVAPTGNKVRGEWLFEPVVGNGHHWEFGMGLTNSVVLWRNTEESKRLSFSCDLHLTHLFKSEQHRVFDLKNKPLSRYMQAFNFETNTWSPLSNLTSSALNVSVAVQTDIVALFNYSTNNWSFDAGYNLWARSCEKFHCKNNSSCPNSCNTCCSTCGQGIIKQGIESWYIDADATINNYSVSLLTTKVTDAMIDYDGARTKGLSNKVFGHVNYMWVDRELVPFLGCGGFAEFGHNSDCCDTCSTDACTDTCSCCSFASLSQWGLWLKGGVSF